MPKVALRSYVHELEGLIEKGQLDEAIAHCRHILKFHPKHLEIYRLLGKAYLEAKRYSEAEDIFNRILVAVPDDFVSHAGMSIVKDEKGKLDEALWHMERAFETQPSNAAIQVELQRLYGRRDGVEPPRIRMTRGALAHMYIQGELYPQAISEIRAILTQDSQRADMQILLAQAFFHSGQNADAAEVCNRLLASLPYCFEANRIMVELLHGKDNIDNAQVYRQRVCELDPYAMYAPDSVFHSAAVPDHTIQVERLASGSREVQVMKNASTVDVQPDWLSKGIGEIKEEAESMRNEPHLSALNQNVSLPSSVKNMPSDEGFSSTDESSAAPSPASPAENIPDFLRAAGWKESNGDAGDVADSSPFEAGKTGELEMGAIGSTEDELIPVELPDWIKAKAPGMDQGKPAETEPLPDWLDQLTASDYSGEKHDDQPSDTTSSLIRGLNEPRSQPVDSVPFHPEEHEIPSPFTEMPEGEGQGSAMPSLINSNDEKISDSIMGIEPIPTPNGISETEQNEAMGWLESLAAKHGAKDEELVTNPAERKDNAPDWVSEVMNEIKDQPSDMKAQEISTTSDDETGLWLRGLNKKGSSSLDTGDTDSEPSAAEEESAPIWLNDLDNKSISEEPVVSGEEDLPGWLQNLKTVSPETSTDRLSDQDAGKAPAERIQYGGEPSEENSKSLPAGSDTSGMTGFKDVDQTPETPGETGATQNEEMDMPNWLKGMDLKTTDADDQDDLTSMPDWLKPMESKLGESAPLDAGKESKLPDMPNLGDLQEEKPASDDEALGEPDLSDWLKSLDDVPPGIPATTAIDTMPRWMKGEMEAPPKTEPTAPSDWRPIEEPNASLPEFKPTADSPQEGENRQSIPTQELKPMKSEGENHELIQAQGSLNSGDLAGALEQYNHFIKKGTFLEETIHDMRQAVYRYPIEVSLWQALGDAYMRANRLQEALDAFNKAEELLR